MCVRDGVLFFLQKGGATVKLKGRVFCSFVAAIEGQSERDEARARQVYLLKRDE
jgi:hypothetical protein